MQEQLFSMFTKTSAVKRAYKKKNGLKDNLPFSIDDYLKIIEAYTHKTIEVREINAEAGWNPKYLKGQLIVMKDKAIILVPTLQKEQGIGVTLCERNFAVMKEACQLLIDHDSPQIETISGLIISIINAGANVILNTQNEIIQSEYIGELAALELLFPSNLREHYRQKVQAKEITTFDVAQIFMIPEHQVINKVFSEAVYPALQDYREEWLELLDEVAYAFNVKEIDVFEDEHDNGLDD